MAWLALRRISSVRAVSGHRVKLSDLGWPRRGRGCILWTTAFSSSLRPDPQAAPDGVGILGSRGKERKARGGPGAERTDCELFWGFRATLRSRWGGDLWRAHRGRYK